MCGLLLWNKLKIWLHFFCLPRAFSVGYVGILTVSQWMIWPPPATWKSIMHRLLEIAGLWDRYESAPLLHQSSFYPASSFCHCLFLSLSLFHSSPALDCSCTPFSLESTVIFKSNQTLDQRLCVCVVRVLCVLVWKWLCSWATMWRGLGQTAVRQEGVCSPLQWCLCTLSQRGKCHWSDAHTHTHKHLCRVNVAVERLSHQQRGSWGWWGVMGKATNRSQWIHCSSETNTKYHMRCKGTHKHRLAAKC